MAINANKLWTNADGLVVRFNGEIGNHDWKFAVSRENGKIVEASAVVNLVDLGANGVSYTSDNDRNGVLDGFHDGDFAIPAGYVVESCRLIVKTAAAGGTSVEVGTYQQNGTVADADAFVTAAQGAVANLTLNAVILGTGAAVGTRTAARVLPALRANGTFTAGVVELQLRLRDAR